jgi:5'-3' exonuclease
MIVVDISQTIISNCVVHLKNELKKNDPQAKSLIKHSFLNSILSYKKKYSSEFGNIVLACDSQTYWRREYFPAYKGHRKHGRASSDLNWDIVFEAVNEIKTDLKDYFPYPVIEVDGAEADDVIACLTRHVQTNELVQDGLFSDEPQKVLIISADQDFIQLQKYPNVKQWSGIQKKWVKPKGKVSDFLMEHILSGDTTDNFPNILTSDQWAIDRSKNETSVRQKPLKKSRIAEFIIKGVDACQNEEERRNFIRNKTLVDFDMIPDTIYSNVVSEYQNYKPNSSKMKLMNYFMRNRFKVLLSSIGEF